jgi:tetratricopeptide (TPR) repeat protein
VRGATLADVVAAAQGSRPERLSGSDFAAMVAARAGMPLPEPMPEVFAGSWVQTCCRIAQSMALALDHAHERGVVHRDLKPSNAMVTPQGRVLLLDFGLAATSGTTRLTRSGALLGTLHYMAPEQVRDQDADARTDVYALGATLYELLALHAPFDAESSDALRQAILGGDLRPLPAHNPGTPRDVDVICRCALDRDPGRRYASSAALAADLDRFLARRPIVARPAGPWLRTRRWAQRHPAWATTAGVLIAAAATTAVVWTRLRQHAEAEVAAAQSDARTEHHTATANQQHALAAIAHQLQRVEDPKLVKTPGLDRFRSSQLDEAVAMLQQLRRDNDGSVSVRHALVRGLVQAAGLRHLLGQPEQAISTLDDAEAELQRLSAQLPGQRQLLIDRATLQSHRGLCLRETGKLAEAEACWNESVALLQPLTDQGHAEDAVLRQLSGTLVNLSTLHQAMHLLAQAEGELRRALHIDEVLVAAAGLPLDRLDCARTRNNLCALLVQAGRLPEARAEYEALLPVYVELAAADAADPERQRELARCRTGFSDAALFTGDRARARAELRQALATFEALVRDFPDRFAYRWERNMVEQRAADAAIADDDMVEAVRLYRSAVMHHEELQRLQPAVAETRSELAGMLCQLGLALGRTDDDEETGPLLERAVLMQSALVGEHPEDHRWRSNLGSMLTNLGLHRLRSREAARARATLEQAEAEYRRALLEGEEEVQHESRLPNLLRILAEACCECTDQAAAVAALARRQEVAPVTRSALLEVGRGLHLHERTDFKALLELARER